jgi:AraC-like DNA-binding protein
MAQVRIFPPSPALREYILAFECITVTTEPGDRFRAVWARPHVTIPIALGPEREAYNYLLGRRLVVPDLLVVGPITRRFADVQLGERQRMFNIVFQPGGLYRLCGEPAGRLADQAVSAGELFGKVISELAMKLRRADGVQAQVAVAEAVLGQLLVQARPADSVHLAAAQQLAAHGTLPITALIAASGQGTRQFERRFLEHFGVSPKRFARIVRLNYALALKSSERQLSWAVVGQMCGYFDQNHLIKDFKAMTGLLPSRFAEHMGCDDAPSLTSWPCAPPYAVEPALRNPH